MTSGFSISVPDSLQHSTTESLSLLSLPRLQFSLLKQNLQPVLPCVNRVQVHASGFSTYTAVHKTVSLSKSVTHPFDALKSLIPIICANSAAIDRTTVPSTGIVVVVIVATTCDRVVLDLPFLRRACRFLCCVCDYKSKGFTLTLVLIGREDNDNDDDDDDDKEQEALPIPTLTAALEAMDTVRRYVCSFNVDENVEKIEDPRKSDSPCRKDKLIKPTRLTGTRNEQVLRKDFSTEVILSMLCPFISIFISNNIVVVIVATACDRLVLDLPFLRRACRFCVLCL
ncbi:hypothetical protein T09_9303 [Trichinella sp. T9]|nr:hypothetical protein T09_9303 [Trichinella sp. T9]